MIYREHLEELKKAPWPRCDQVAAEIARLPGASETLAEAARKARGHNARSAALKALATINRAMALVVAEKLLDDPSYEVRMDAESLVGPRKKRARPAKKSGASVRKGKTTKTIRSRGGQ